ncbi:hypothetical protein F8M41_018536 [Gigaspora margarita]|uniref:Uncharacterized protein n=1 Tax=Gigaspora margarita TaxID=4874 RepID=A0A8H4ALG3_GIGMA|nr:hypothetical protein F8M41_018536 [Gigaspora margarita]
MTEVGEDNRAEVNNEKDKSDEEDGDEARSCIWSKIDEEKVKGLIRVRCCYQDGIWVKGNNTFSWKLKRDENRNTIGRFNPGGRYDNICLEDRFPRAIVQNVDVGVENNRNNGIAVVCKIDAYKERRIVVSSNRRYQVSDKKIDKLPESSKELQDIECADKQRSGSGEKVFEVVNIRKDGKRIDINAIIDNEMNDLLFDPGGSVF